MLRIFILPCYIALTACSLGGGNLPEDHFYRLPAIQLEAHKQPVFDHIVLRPVRSSGLLHDRAILFVEAGRPLQLQRYHYHFWSEAPARLVHTALQQAFESRNIARHITEDIDEERPDRVIQAELQRFERYIDGDSIQAKVELYISVRDPALNTRPWSRLYRIEVPSTGRDFHTTAEAFGRALQQISQALTEDLQKPDTP